MDSGTERRFSYRLTEKDYAYCREMGNLPNNPFFTRDYYSINSKILEEVVKIFDELRI